MDSPTHLLFWRSSSVGNPMSNDVIQIVFSMGYFAYIISGQIAELKREINKK